MNRLDKLIDKLEVQGVLSHEEYVELLSERDEAARAKLGSLARHQANKIYGNKIFLRGLIEFTNICKNDCYYCGIRNSNNRAERYRLSKTKIYECCRVGYTLGLRTFVLQGGEDSYFTDDLICEIISDIKAEFPDCAITLSIGEKSRDSYQKYYDAGADRYLLRHETADEKHYALLHPDNLSLQNRKRCLSDLKDIGFQIGAGFMVDSPGQSYDTLASDFAYLKELNPHMIGIGPFVHHNDTPFREMPDGTLELTLYCLSILRVMFPKVLLPATTALGTIEKCGREKGILAGANVIMPSISPKNVRGKYMLYDGKLSVDEEAIETYNLLKKQIADIGYEAVSERGDYEGWGRK